MKVFVTACLFAGLIVLPARADIIYFKDGMKTICQGKAWEEDGEIKCEYDGWIISYQKNDVLRIVSTIREKKTPPADKKPQVGHTTPKASAEKKIKSPRSKSTGPVFYDPRRPAQYWTGINSKHKSYKEAIQALAKKYKSTPQWVQAHMGDSNDLAQIHTNLANPQSNQSVPVAQPAAIKTAEIFFYNPRRPFPYWTGKNSKHKSYKDAIQSLAKKYECSPEWVKANMGATNDLKQIHQNLRDRKAADPTG